MKKLMALLLCIIMMFSMIAFAFSASAGGIKGRDDDPGITAPIGDDDGGRGGLWDLLWAILHPHG